jgi:hypothetical protein
MHVPANLHPFVRYLCPPYAISSFLATDTGPESLHKPDEQKFDVIVKHIRDILCAGDRTSYEIIETWLAELFFDPMQKYPTCPVFKGSMGIGKSQFFEFIRKGILGNDLCPSPSSKETCTGRFNGLIEGKLLIVFNEEDTLKKGPMKADSVRVFKTLISETDHCVERKYKEVRANVPSFARYTMLSNLPVPVEWELNERRMVVVEAQKVFPTQEYFQKFADMLTDEKRLFDMASHFLGYLKCLRERKFSTEPITEGGISERYAHECNGGYETNKLRRQAITPFFKTHLRKHISKKHVFFHALGTGRFPRRDDGLPPGVCVEPRAFVPQGVMHEWYVRFESCYARVREREDESVAADAMPWDPTAGGVTETVTNDSEIPEKRKRGRPKKKIPADGIAHSPLGVHPSKRPRTGEYTPPIDTGTKVNIGMGVVSDIDIVSEAKELFSCDAETSLSGITREGVFDVSFMEKALKNYYRAAYEEFVRIANDQISELSVLF